MIHSINKYRKKDTGLSTFIVIFTIELYIFYILYEFPDFRNNLKLLILYK